MASRGEASRIAAIDTDTCYTSASTAARDMLYELYAVMGYAGAA